MPVPVELEITLTNEMNGQKLSSKEGTAEDSLVKLIEFNEANSIVELKSNFVEYGEVLKFEVGTTNQAQNLIANIQAKVTRKTQENQASSISTVELKYVKFDKAQVEKILTLMRNTQETAGKLFAMMKE